MIGANKWNYREQGVVVGIGILSSSLIGKIVQEVFNRLAIDLSHWRCSIVLPARESKHVDIQVHVHLRQSLAVLGYGVEVVATEESKYLGDVRIKVEVFVLCAHDQVHNIQLEVVLIVVVAVLEPVRDLVETTLDVHSRIQKAVCCQYQDDSIT